MKVGGAGSHAEPEGWWIAAAKQIAGLQPCPWFIMYICTQDTGPSLQSERGWYIQGLTWRGRCTGHKNTMREEGWSGRRLGKYCHGGGLGEGCTEYVLKKWKVWVFLLCPLYFIFFGGRENAVSWVHCGKVFGDGQQDAEEKLEAVWV
jgi:hypothetical protein